MSEACGCSGGTVTPGPHGGGEETDTTPAPWWRDRGMVVPALSGVALGAGLICEWSSADRAALVLFWGGLVLGGWTFVPGALRRLARTGRPGIGLLMTISATGAVILGHIGEAAALAFLYSIAEALEDRAMDRARRGLRALLDLVPRMATVVRDGVAVEIPARELTTGQMLLVRPGERVATDGIVRTGHSSLDTSAITGESIPVAVAPGDPVAAGSVNATGSLEVTTTAGWADNSLATIVGIVEQAQAEKGDRARLADRIARPLVPGVMILSLLVAVIGSLLGDPEVWITRALVVLVAASPCALAIAVPVTVVSAIGAASRFGMIITSGAAFERLGGVRHVAFDKTGTLTRNAPTVASVVARAGADRREVLALAAALERHSTHPLALALGAAVPSPPPATHVGEQPGAGLTGSVGGHPIRVGGPRWIDPGPLREAVAEFEADGKTCMVVARDGGVIGAIGIRDELRPEVPEVIRTLRAGGVGVTMLTGDNPRTAEALAAEAGIGDVRAGLRPSDKARAVGALSSVRPTAMIGDGVNDAPALAAATVGIAMGTSGSDAAIESADVAFTGHDLRLIPQALHHARRGRGIIHQNIVLSLLIIAALVPLAITGTLSLAAVVLVHEGAEVIVIANGMRAARTRRTALPPAGTTADAVPAPELGIARP